MAHETQITGKLSELTVARALLSSGWEVADPVVDEKYDLIAKEEGSDFFVTIQIKTIRRRTDRNNEMVIYATNSKGEPYQPHDCDYIAGVEGDTVYLVPCSGIKEYWATDDVAAKKWLKFTAGTSYKKSEEDR